MNFWDKHKSITLLYESLTKSVLDKYNLTQMEYDTLMFLHYKPEQNTLAEIVRARKSTKSHVSTSLKHLEQKGFIEKKPRKENKKYVEIFLSRRANDIVVDGVNCQKKFMKSLFRNLSDDEMNVFTEIFSKICKNAEECL